MTTLEDRIARLEALVERQAAIIEQQQWTIERQEKTIAELERRLAEREGKPRNEGRGGTPPPRAERSRPRWPAGPQGRQARPASAREGDARRRLLPVGLSGCGAKLSKTADAAPHVHQVVDIPPIEPEFGRRVHTRKSSLGSQSARGDRFVANLKSVVHTCRKQQRHVLNDLVAAIQAAFSKASAPSLLAATP